jgi:hypothetical protein
MGCGVYGEVWLTPAVPETANDVVTSAVEAISET